MCYGHEFCGTESHPYELYLALNEIEHRRTREPLTGSAPTLTATRRPEVSGLVRP
jgi:hypothetical protein